VASARLAASRAFAEISAASPPRRPGSAPCYYPAPMDVAERTYGPKECGSCRLWRPIAEDARGPVGPCRLNVRTGDFPGTAPTCERYMARDAALPGRTAPPLPLPRPRTASAPVVRRVGEGGPDRAPDVPEEFLAMTREEFAETIREVLRDEAPQVPLAPKWEGGTMVLRPRDPSLQPKEIPLGQLFHKMVMIRDRLRVLEQKINSNAKLSDAEKVDIQCYVTRCYGSLTTFNVLFREERDRFVGDKGTS